MRFDKYIADRKVSVLCFILLMMFISLVIYLDGPFKAMISDILYINLVCFSFFIIYLVCSYLYNRSYYKSLTDIAENERDEIINRLPKPTTNEQILFHDVLLSLYDEQIYRIHGLYKQKKDYEEFITSWVHEVKTPISVCRLLIESNLSSSNSDVLHSFEEELDKIEHYIEQVLYYSKIDDFSKDYLINEIELDRLVKEAVKKQAKTFINKKINIQIDNTDLTVSTDKLWLSFIVDQVLSNALKYTPAGGRIKIYVLAEEKAKKLVIEDNGIGIRPEDLGRVFEKGFTGYNGRENYKSTGLGLYLSRELARKLGHDIDIESKYGEYTKITIIFPRLSDYLEVLK